MNVPSDGFIIGLEGVEQEAVRPGGACLTFEEADDVDRGVVPQFPLLTAVGRHYRSFLPTSRHTKLRRLHAPAQPEQSTPSGFWRQFREIPICRRAAWPAPGWSMPRAGRP